MFLSLLCRVKKDETCPAGLRRGKHVPQGQLGETCPTGLRRGNMVRLSLVRLAIALC